MRKHAISRLPIAHMCLLEHARCSQFGRSCQLRSSGFRRGEDDDCRLLNYPRPPGMAGYQVIRPQGYCALRLSAPVGEAGARGDQGIRAPPTGTPVSSGVAHKLCLQLVHVTWLRLDIHIPSCHSVNTERYISVASFAFVHFPTQIGTIPRARATLDQRGRSRRARSSRARAVQWQSAHEGVAVHDLDLCTDEQDLGGCLLRSRFSAQRSMRSGRSF